jgi:hypothetical protein
MWEAPYQSPIELGLPWKSCVPSKENNNSLNVGIQKHSEVAVFTRSQQGCKLRVPLADGWPNFKLCHSCFLDADRNLNGSGKLWPFLEPAAVHSTMCLFGCNVHSGKQC